MISGSGISLSYSDVESIIESIVKLESSKHIIPGYDKDDIAQEIRIECWRVLPAFYSESVEYSPFKFFKICVSNRLFNLKRGIWVPNNPPCVRCPLWDKANKKCVVNEEGCEKIVEYRNNLAIKAQLRSPNVLETDIPQYEDSSDVNAILLDESIRSVLPERLLKHYDSLLSGEEVPYSAKRKIREIALEIINNAENL